MVRRFIREAFHSAQSYFRSESIRIRSDDEGGVIKRDNTVNDINIADRGGRRKNGDRRNFTYTIHIPERRHGYDRRTGDDRRKEDRPSDKA